MQPSTKKDSTFPSVIITNGILSAELYLPDAKEAYYRGTRFDWSGVMPRLDYQDHSFFGKWNPAPYDPCYHDAIMGPVEEFTEIGFAGARPGESFLKIGVGALIKPDDEPYSFLRYYQISNPGSWEVIPLSDQVTFVHTLSDAAGYSYEYRKTVRLMADQSVMIIDHTLTNTGPRAIETSVYNHNFFMIDQEPTGPNILTTFPFEVRAEGLNFGTIAHAQNKSIVYERALTEGENVYCADVLGFGASQKKYDILIQNLNSGAEVRITGNQPLEKLVYWSCPTSSCPEPYVAISVPPGEVKTWGITYEFGVR